MSSPSSLGREVECLASTVFPHTKSTGPRAVRGTALHRFLCAHAQAKTEEEQEEALEEVDISWRPAAASIDWSRMPALTPELGVPELALAWNPTTGEVRELGRNGAVEHDDVAALLQPGEVFAGIIDWCAFTSDNGVFIADWKFGWQSLERAEVNAQLRSLGFMAAKHFGREKAVVSYARIFDNGTVSWDIAVMDTMKLDAAESFVRLHLKAVAEAQLAYRNSGVIPTPQEGGHCRYCPAQNSCSAKVALLLSVMSGDQDKASILARLPEPLTQEAVVALWPKLQQAAQLIERLTENVKDVVRIWGPVKLANGKVLAEVEKPFETIDPEYAREPLKARFGEAVESIIKKEESLTKKALDGLLHDHSSHGGKAKLKKAVMAELDEAGALRVVVKRAIEEVSPESKKLKSAEERRQLAAENEASHG